MNYIKKINTNDNINKYSIKCNNCGREFITEDNMIERDNDMEFHDYEHTGSYFSRIGDSTNVKFRLCDDCLIKIMANFVIPPTFKDVECYSMNQEAVQKEYEEWLQKFKK
jgi:hypothetical protein